MEKTTKRKIKFVSEFKNEREFTHFLVHRLNALGHYAWRNNSGIVHLGYQNKAGKSKFRRLMMGQKGSSDILGVTKSGKFLAIECKMGTNKMTDNQKQFLIEIGSRGGTALCISDREDYMGIVDLIR